MMIMMYIVVTETSIRVCPLLSCSSCSHVKLFPSTIIVFTDNRNMHTNIRGKNYPPPIPYDFY